jgi:hemerythrin-like domain-containing protein
VNAIELLKRDHQEVRDLYTEYKEVGVRSVKRKTAMIDEICGLLETHMAVEEQVFYPRVQEAAPSLVEEGRREHGEVKDLIKEIRKAAGKDERAEDMYVKFGMAMQGVEHHVDEEEREMFPKVEKAMKGALDALGEEMLRRKEKIGKAA